MQMKPALWRHASRITDATLPDPIAPHNRIKAAYMCVCVLVCVSQWEWVTEKKRESEGVHVCYNSG